MMNDIHEGLKRGSKTHPRIYQMRVIERRLITKFIKRLEENHETAFKNEFPPILETDEKILIQKENRENKILIDPWGIYRVHFGEIVLFNENIKDSIKEIYEKENTFINSSLNLLINEKDFKSVVLFHEFGHWLFHRYPIKNSTYWPKPEWNPFSYRYDEYLTEGFAQVIACLISSKDKKLARIFNKKVSNQDKEYLAHGEILEILDIRWDKNNKFVEFIDLTDEKINILIKSFIYLRKNEINKYFLWKIVLCFMTNNQNKLKDIMNNLNYIDELNEDINKLKDIIKDTEKSGNTNIIKDFLDLLIKCSIKFSYLEDIKINDFLENTNIKFFDNIDKNIEWFDTNILGLKNLIDIDQNNSKNKTSLYKIDNINNKEKIIIFYFDCNYKNNERFSMESDLLKILENDKSYIIIDYFINKKDITICSKILSDIYVNYKNYRYYVVEVLQYKIKNILEMYDTKEEFIKDEMLKLIITVINDNQDDNNINNIKKIIKERFNLNDSDFNDLFPEPVPIDVIKRKIKLSIDNLFGPTW